MNEENEEFAEVMPTMPTLFSIEYIRIMVGKSNCKSLVFHSNLKLNYCAINVDGECFLL